MLHLSLENSNPGQTLWNPLFSSTVDCAEGGQEWEKEATNVETFDPGMASSLLLMQFCGEFIKIRVNRLLLALVLFISLFILLAHFSGSAKKAFRDGWIISNYDKGFQQSSNVPNE